MTIKEIYNLAIQMGIKADFRGQEGIRKFLENKRKQYEKMAQAGIGTIVGMHISEEHKKEAENSHINVVIAGHISSDSLGMNLFLDELEKQGLKIIPCSGFTRIFRVK